MAKRFEAAAVENARELNKPAGVALRGRGTAFATAFKINANDKVKMKKEKQWDADSADDADRDNLLKIKEIFDREDATITEKGKFGSLREREKR